MQKKTLVIFILVGTLIGFTIRNSIQKNYLKNGKETTGKVIEYSFCNNSWCGDYEYYVEEKRYLGHWSGSFFKCNDSIKGCLGEKFIVTYSVEKPEISEINLGNYNKHKDYKPSF